MATLELNDLTVNDSTIETVILNDTSISVGDSVNLTANDSSTLIGTADNVVATGDSTIEGTATNLTLQDSATLTGESTTVVATDNSTVDGTATNVTLLGNSDLSGDATNVTASGDATITGSATNVTLEENSTLIGAADNVIAGDQSTITGVVNESLSLVGTEVAIDSQALVLATVTVLEPPVITQQPQTVNTIMEDLNGTATIALSVGTTSLNPQFQWQYKFNLDSEWTDYVNPSDKTVVEGNTKIMVTQYSYVPGIKKVYFRAKVSEGDAYVYSNQVEANFDKSIVLPTLAQISATNYGVINEAPPSEFYSYDIQWQYSYDNSTWKNARMSGDFYLLMSIAELQYPNNTYYRYKASSYVSTSYSNSVQLFIPNTNSPKIKITYPNKNLYLFTKQSRVVKLNAVITENDATSVYWVCSTQIPTSFATGDQFGSAATASSLTINTTVHTELLLSFPFIVATAVNEFGASVSNAIQCIYDSLPVLTDPTESDVFADNDGNFTVNASFENADTIEWFYYNSNQNAWVSLLTESVVNKTSHSVTRNAYDFMPANTTLKYVLTNIIGTTTSRERTVRVIHTVLPTFVTQPIDVGYVSENTQSSYTFTVSAINSLRIDWETSTSPDIESSWYRTERSTNTLVVPVTTCNTMRWYRARAVNVVGSVTSLSASLGILTTPLFQNNLEQPIVSSTGNFVLSVNQLFGSTITWQTKLEDDANWTTISTENITKKFNPTYSENISNFPGNRMFRCVITNSVGTITSNEVNLDLNYGKTPPEFTQQPVLDQYTTAEIPFNLSLTAVNANSLTWQMKYEMPIGSGRTITTNWGSIGYNKPSTLITPLGWPQNTKLYYRCIANNKYGSTTSDVVSTTIFRSNLDFTIYNFWAAEEAVEGYNKRLQVPYVFTDNKCAFVVFSLSYGNQTVYPSQIIWQGSIDGATGWTDIHTSDSYDYPTELGNSLLYQDFFVNSPYNEPTLFGGELVTYLYQQPIYSPSNSNAFVYLLDVVNDATSYNYIRFRVPNEIGLPLYSNSVKLVKSNADRLPKFVTQPPSNLGTIIIETEEIVDPNDNTKMSWRYKNADFTLSTSFTNTEQYSGVMSSWNFMFWEISSVWLDNDNIKPSSYLMTEDPYITQAIAEQATIGYKNTEWTAASIHVGILPSSTYNIRPVVCNPYGRTIGNYCSFTILNEPLLTNTGNTQTQSVINGNVSSTHGTWGYEIITSKSSPNNVTYSSEISAQWEYTQDVDNINSYPWTNIGNAFKVLSAGMHTTFNTLTDIYNNKASSSDIAIIVNKNTFPNPTGRLAFRVKYSDVSTQGKYSRPVKFVY